MLTDIFSRRYESVKLCHGIGDNERRLFIQAFRILREDVCPYYRNGMVDEESRTFWGDLEARFSRELGLRTLSSNFFRSTMPLVDVCEEWIVQDFYQSGVRDSADQFFKERISLIELGFRMREQQIAFSNSRLPVALEMQKKVAAFSSTGSRIPGDPTTALVALNNKMNQDFARAVEELNVRFQQADFELHYHNGFIQLSADPRVAKEIEEPFWNLVAGPTWVNVDHDMKEAIDRRDSGKRDPAFYAARALESTIKIISDQKGWTRGVEKGAHNYIDNLKSKDFISGWELEDLKSFFTKIRNPLGHGPGGAKMPSLSEHQTNWAVEHCMTWIKSLVRRM